MSDCLSADRVQEAFLAAPPLISSQILDLTMKHPLWMRDLYQLEEWPTGAGTQMQQLVFRGSKPPIERNFDKWRKVGNLQGCDPCDAPDCSYNTTTFSGYGFERKLTELMYRDFKSPPYCIAEIQTTAHFREVFAKLVENLYSQIDFFKEVNIGQTTLTSLAKKYVVDSDGPKANPNNPYVYRNIGGATLGTLGIELLEFFYEQIRRLPEAVPYDVVDGSPIYSLIASHQLLGRMYRDDPQLRQDVRFSGLANDLLMKYNFMSTIRGMFIAAPILYPRRFNIVAGEPVEVLPFVNDVPAEYGSYSYLNPGYEAATHEEVLIHGKYPFKVFYQPMETSLGEGTSFGPEYSFMNNWQWINPLTWEDPARRVGYFFTSARIGISAQFSEGIFGFLVTRPSVKLTAIYTPVPVCPPDIPDCDNTVPAVVCPCPVVISISTSPFTPANYIIVFATPIDAEADDPIVLQLDSGGTVSGTVEQISTDGLTLEISFATDGLLGVCPTNVTGVSCTDQTLCCAVVVSQSQCRSDQTDMIELVLSNAIRAAVSDEVVAYFGDCTTALLTVLAIDAMTNTYSFGYAAGYGPTDDPTGIGATELNASMLCDRHGISKVCVPPATDETCPPCEVTSAPCSDSGSII